MKNKINISIEKMLELESYKKETLPLTQNIDELKYWIYTIKMPIEEIKQALNIYDESSPKLDEIKFINYLKTKYNQSRENVILRISQVREIMKYERELKNKNNQKIKKK